MKYYLQQELTNAKTLFVQQQCQGWSVVTEHFSRFSSCTRTRNVAFAHNWDRVAIEYPYHGYVLDVALLQGNKLLTAIEVFVTHHVEEDKKSALNQFQIPWVEIQASEAFYSGDSPWTARSALEPLAVSFPIELQGWMCADCVKDFAIAQRDAQSAAIWPSTNQETMIVSLIRLVDIYYRSGKHFREIFSLKHIALPDGTISKAWLEIGDYKKGKTKTIQRAQPPISNESFNDLKRAFHTYLDGIRKKGNIVDSPMSWHAWPRGLRHGQVFFESDVFPLRYALSNNGWVKIASYQDLSWEGYWEDPARYQWEVTWRRQNAFRG